MSTLGHLIGALLAALDDQHQRDKKNRDRPRDGQRPDHTTGPRSGTRNESTKGQQNRCR